MGFKGLQCLLGERDDPQRVRRFAVRAEFASHEHPADVEDLRVAVDVATLEREYLRGP
jgi:hypothetical protein